jgi:ABC-type antimicrobial peptide transport system permease subunit
LLDAVASVQNTYISAFAALGALGMLLGTGMLAAMLVRGARERRKELALLAAVGFRARDITDILLYETAGLLIAGMVWGSLCALAATAPYLAQGSAAPNWAALAATLAAVVAVGVAACFLAGLAVTRGPLLAALRSE